jgi:hypothetical protein
MNRFLQLSLMNKIIIGHFPGRVFPDKSIPCFPPVPEEGAPKINVGFHYQ